MYVQQCGNPSAPMILFLHGVGQSGGMWDLHMQELSAQGYYCVAPDLPGHGRSNTERWTDLNDVARKVVELVNPRNRARIHVVGLSLGGSLAITLLNSHPYLLESAVIDGAGAAPIRFHRLMIAGVALVSPFVGKAPVISLVAGMLGLDREGRTKFEHDMKSVTAHAFRTAFAQANAMAKPTQMGRVTSRVLLIAGEKEPAEVRQWQSAMSKAMSKAQACVVPREGHGGLLARNPDLHVRMVRSWVEGTPLPEELTKNATEGALQEEQGAMMTKGGVSS